MWGEWLVTEKIISVWDTDKMCEGFQEGLALWLWVLSHAPGLHHFLLLSWGFIFLPSARSATEWKFTNWNAVKYLKSRVNWLLINLCWMALIFACFQPHQGTEGWDIQWNMWKKWFLKIWSSMTNFFLCCLLILFLLPTWLVAKPQERCFCAQLLVRWIAGSSRLNSQPPAVHWFRCQCCGHSSGWFWNTCSCACQQQWGQSHSHNPLRNFISLCNSCGFF